MILFTISSFALQREADDDVSGEQARVLRLELTGTQMKIAALQQELDTARREKLQAATAKEMVGFLFCFLSRF